MMMGRNVRMTTRRARSTPTRMRGVMTTTTTTTTPTRRRRAMMRGRNGR